MIIGLDVGNANTNTSESIMFASRVQKNEAYINLRPKNDKNLLIIDGKKYLVGEGDYQTEPNKLDKELYKACVMTALARSCSEDTEMKIVIGLPACQYNEKNKDKLKNEILSDRIYNFELAGKERIVVLEDIEVFHEGAAPYYGMTKEQRAELGGHDLVLVNIGGGNTNIAHFKNVNGKRSLEKSTTVMSGILHLFADVVNAVNGEFSISKAMEDAEDILKNGIEIFGVKQDLSFLKPIILIHTEKIFKELNMYPIKTAKVMFTGGGSKTLRQLLKARVPGSMFQTNNLFSTAYGLKKVGEALWQE